MQGFPERRGKWPVSAEGGRTPAWRADGKELYWVGPDGTLMAASVELQAAGVRVGRTEALFRLPTEDRFASFQPGATDGGFWCMSRKVRRRTGRWWWLRIGRRGWEGSAVKSVLLYSGRIVEICHGPLVLPKGEPEN